MAFKNAPNILSSRASSYLLLSEQASPGDDNIQTELRMNDNWYGVVAIGSPKQYVKFLFDTGSSTTWVRSSLCKSSACDNKKHSTPVPATNQVTNPYDLEKSNTSELVSNKPSEIHYGTGSVQMKLGEDAFFLFDTDSGNELVAKDVQFGLATGLSKEPFSYFDFDGLFGLSFDSLSLRGQKPTLYQMKEAGVIDNILFTYKITPLLKLDLKNHDKTELRGEIGLGSIDPKYAGEDLSKVKFMKVIDAKYWSVDLAYIKVSTDDSNVYGGSVRTRKIDLTFFDTGTTDVIFPSAVAKALVSKVPLLQLYKGIIVVECAKISELPDIKFGINSGSDDIVHEFIKKPSQYVYTDVQENGMCATTFSYDEQYNNLILGESFLEFYYSVWDLDNHRIGLAELN